MELIACAVVGGSLVFTGLVSSEFGQSCPRAARLSQLAAAACSHVTVLGLCLWAGKGLGDGFWAHKKLTKKPSHEVSGNDYQACFSRAFTAAAGCLCARARVRMFCRQPCYVSESFACAGVWCAVGGATLKCAATEASKEVRP
jgi:hypothetical protein